MVTTQDNIVVENNTTEDTSVEILPDNIVETTLERHQEREDAVDNAIRDDLGIGARIQNICWEEYCDKFDFLQYITPRTINEEIPFAFNQLAIEGELEYQVLILDKMTYYGRNMGNRLFTSSTSHILPYLEESRTCNIRTKTDKGINNKGITFQMESDKCGLICFVPFLNGKKIYGYYIKKTNYNGFDQMQFFNVGKCNHDDCLYNLIVPSFDDSRGLSDVLTEEDRIRIANSSSKFRKLVNNWQSVYTAIDYFNWMLFETLDPGYMYKLMELNRMISFGIVERATA